ncbi:MAG: hypothetical protein KDI62_20835 [Anaerolineae bacterium]|nr:hypothetical protein [Anaerolineae bacterium]MCB9108450.1 hypothetical protein [Anaerolineales bacterium]
MTPTLWGRWQTRLLLLGTIGLLITIGFGALFGNFVTPLALLGYVLLLGLAWDIVYQALQSLRWDRDWPPLFMVGGGLLEALLLWGLIKADFLWAGLGLAGLPGVAPGLTLAQFALHYGTVFTVIFLIMFGPMKVIFLKWRFRGGQFF